MDNEKIILFMGRLVYEKGIQHLISAMPKILEGYRMKVLHLDKSRSSYIRDYLTEFSHYSFSLIFSKF